MRPVLRVPLKQDVQRGQIGTAGHGAAVKSEIVGQRVDEEERRLVAITAEQYRTVLELRPPEQDFRLPRQEGAVDHRQERELDNAARDPLFVDDEGGRLAAEAGRHLGHVRRAWTVQVFEGQLEGPSLRLRLADGCPRHVGRPALNDRSMKLRTQDKTHLHITVAKRCQLFVMIFRDARHGCCSLCQYKCTLLIPSVT